MTRQTKTTRVPFTSLWVFSWLTMGLPPVHRWDAALVSLLVFLILDALGAVNS